MNHKLCIKKQMMTYMCIFKIYYQKFKSYVIYYNHH